MTWNGVRFRGLRVEANSWGGLHLMYSYDLKTHTSQRLETAALVTVFASGKQTNPHTINTGCINVLLYMTFRSHDLQLVWSRSWDQNVILNKIFILQVFIVCVELFPFCMFLHGDIYIYIYSFPHAHRCFRCAEFTLTHESFVSVSVSRELAVWNAFRPCSHKQVFSKMQLFLCCLVIHQHSFAVSGD